MSGGRAWDGGDDVNLDWTLPWRICRPVRTLARVQLAPAAPHHIPYLPLRQWDSHLQDWQEREEEQAQAGPRYR